MEDRKIHPAAEIFPLMEGEAFEAFVADIKENGLRERIVVLLETGEIIDGRNRYRACVAAGVKPEVRLWEPSEKVGIVDYVMSLNLHRRHLTPSQRAIVAARARDMYDQQAKERMQAGKKNPVVTLTQGREPAARDLAGKAAGVSGTYVDRATKVIENGSPELIKAVEEGRMNVTTAAVLSTEPVDVQIEECAKPKRSRTYNSVSAPLRSPSESEQPKPVDVPQIQGVGIVRANEAINILSRIPKNDQQRKRGFQIVTDWLKSNK